eukprot:16436215-Heterocapsa_arctica.AAC.1
MSGGPGVVVNGGVSCCGATTLNSLTRMWGHRGGLADAQPCEHQDVPQDTSDDLDVEGVAQGVALPTVMLWLAQALLGTGE